MQKADIQINYEFRMRLQEEFSRRMRVNARYSIRAFAQHLGVHSSTVSKILSGKRALSEKNIATLSAKIGLPPIVKMPQEDAIRMALVHQDAFAVISDWYHFAILDLTLLKSFKSDAKWIAKKLDITPFEASLAIERLLRLGLLKEHQGRLVKTEMHFSNYTEGQTSAAHKEYQRQILRKALIAIDTCPAEKKDITSMTIAADSRKLAAAKERIRKFRRELCAFLEDGQGDSVYHLGLQLYPVTIDDIDMKYDVEGNT